MSGLQGRLGLALSLLWSSPLVWGRFSGGLGCVGSALPSGSFGSTQQACCNDLRGQLEDSCARITNNCATELLTVRRR